MSAMKNFMKYDVSTDYVKEVIDIWYDKICN